MATDTAALTGSSLSSQQRRYGAKGIVDKHALTTTPSEFCWD